jgi:hypothetical protein
MSRRPDTSSPSTIPWQIRVTREEDDRAKALAEYRNDAVGKPAESFSDMVRRLINAERQRIVDAGFRPPLKPKRAREHNGDGA